MSFIAARLNRIKPLPSSMAGQRARELRATGRDIVGLTSGEPDFDTPPNVCEAVVRAMAASKTKYTDVGGTPEPRPRSTTSSAATTAWTMQPTKSSSARAASRSSSMA